VPVANAIGTKPSEATRAVMTTGRSRVSAPGESPRILIRLTISVWLW